MSEWSWSKRRPLEGYKTVLDRTKKTKGHVKLKGGEPKFLSGRYSPLSEILRLFRIFWEFFRGFRVFHSLGPAVTVFGSARFTKDHPYYQVGIELGKRLAEEGFVTVTGGGPGLMEATSRGAYEAGGVTVGANIVLPREQAPNLFLTHTMTFYYFFVRKVILIKYSSAYIVLPGGFGTLDEMMEAMMLIQNGKLNRFPIILVGAQYWQGLIHWMKNTMIKDSAISVEDLKDILMTDDIEEAIFKVKSSTQSLFEGSLKRG